MKEIIKKYKYYILILFTLVTSSIIIFKTINKEVKEEIVFEPLLEEEITEEVNVVEEIKTLKVDVKGEVNAPGVYELEEGKRVSDAIELSGGLTDKADTTLINLSKNLKDEMVIVIYNKNEIEKLREDLTTTKTVIEYIEKECSCPDTVNDACISPAKETKTTKSQDNSSNEVSSGLVNINTATKEELTAVSGIGDTKAEAIIKYREENGFFNNIKDITKVSGIGESTFEKIKDNITV